MTNIFWDFVKTSSCSSPSPHRVTLPIPASPRRAESPNGVAVFPGTARPYINKTGTTQFRLRFKLDDDNDNLADYMKFFSGNYTTSTSCPLLIIQYYVP